jgi:uncharacterized membrane protein YeaQ/YmgE (transglycosylase-associated protein family)
MSINLKGLNPLASLKLFSSRITSSRYTLLYFSLACIHCILQVTFQSLAFKVNVIAASNLGSIVDAGEYSEAYAYLENDGPLHLCKNANDGSNPHDCRIAWGANLSAPAQSNGGPNTIAPEYQSTMFTISSVSVTASGSRSAIVLPSSVIETELGDRPTQAVSEPTKENDSPSTPSSTRGPQAAPARTGSVSVTLPSTISTSALEPVPTQEGSATFSILSTGTSASTPEPTNAAPQGQRRKRSFEVEEIKENGELKSVRVTGLPIGPVVATKQCVEAIVWPLQILLQTRAEDVTLLAFQVWTLSMSIVAILNESIPHVIAAFLTHCLGTAWSGFQIWHTAAFRSEFNRLTRDGACNGINFLPGIWGPRDVYGISLLTVNSIALIFFGFLTWKLVQIFGWQTFKRVGASLVVNRVYKLVLLLAIFVQLTFFFIVAIAGLWMYILYNSNLANWSSSTDLFKRVFIPIPIALVPWLFLGWFAPRREQKLAMSCFIFISLGLIGTWCAMFVSGTYRFAFQDWRFFSIISVIAAFLTLVTTTLAVICLFNFGKGLLHYLDSQEQLEDEDDCTEKGNDLEKNSLTEQVRFPSGRSSGGDQIPTFSAVFPRTGTQKMVMDNDIDSVLGKRDSVTSISIDTHSIHGRSQAISPSDTASNSAIENIRSHGLERHPSDSSYHSQKGSYHVPQSGEHVRKPSNGSSKQKKWTIE